MGAGVFLIQDGGALVEMSEKPYGSEDMFQELLAKYPSLIAGDQVNSESPRRWILVTREVAVPGAVGGAGRWSCDHLFLDQDAIPTLVEVKRSSDTRIRREVVGQMLDYTANAVLYWPVGTIRSAFENTWANHELGPDEKLREFLGCQDLEAFWQLVETNLREGRVRMLFVADSIPRELQRIVEFLNEQMSSAEVLAVEIKQFVGQGQRTLVPRVIGHTSDAERTKSTSRASRQWDEASFFSEMEVKKPPAEVAVVREILNWAKKAATRIWRGRGATMGSFVPVVAHNDTDHQLFAVYTGGSFEVYFQYLKTHPSFALEQKRLELAHRLSAATGFPIGIEDIGRRPNISTEILTRREALEGVLKAYDWVVSEIRAS